MVMLNPLDLTGRTILVTGASSGIGRAIAVLVSNLGARVILVARNRKRVDETYSRLAGAGHVVEVHDLDAYDAIPAWLRGLTSVHGPLDGLVHSAGVQLTAPLKVMEAGQVELLFRINALASLWLAKGFRYSSAHTSGASLVFISSVAGLIGQPSLSAYSASKGAVVALARSLAMELLRDRIRVNCVAPGMVRTEMIEEASGRVGDEHLAAIERDHPLGFGEPEDVANAVAFLLSSAARWITGSVLVVDGGYTAQ